MSLPQLQTVEASIRRVAARMPELSVEHSLTVRIATLLGRELSARMDHWLAPSGLSETELRVLFTVFAHGEEAAYPGELGAALAQSPANMTRLTDALVERGLIRRVPSAEDRRRMQLHVTPAGETLVCDLLPGMGAFTRDLFRDFRPEELSRLLSDLKRVFTALQGLSQYRPTEQGT
jgi:MarR family transcriptional regulator, negative regulator of the multidrug operon emrRAB